MVFANTIRPENAIKAQSETGNQGRIFMKSMDDMRAAFLSLGEQIKADAGGREVIYIPNPGNFGDGLIRYGAKQLFHDLGIQHRELNIGYGRVRYQLMPYLIKAKKYYFVYGGGGAWSDAFAFGHRIAQTISRRTGALTVLPSTFGFPIDLSSGTLYRRDEGQSAENAPNARFCHDMAFYVACRAANEGVNYGSPTRSVGLMMRQDEESRFSGGVFPEGNRDVSLEGDHMSNADDFLREIAKYETVYSDRLHVGIAGCITGRTMKVIPNNYFKTAAIFDASIAPFFADRVELMDADFGLADLPAASDLAPAKV